MRDLFGCSIFNLKEKKTFYALNENFCTIQKEHVLQGFNKGTIRKQPTHLARTDSRLLLMIGVSGPIGVSLEKAAWTTALPRLLGRKHRRKHLVRTS